MYLKGTEHNSQSLSLLILRSFVTLKSLEFLCL